jgi:ribosomal protein L31
MFVQAISKCIKMNVFGNSHPFYTASLFSIANFPL